MEKQTYLYQQNAQAPAYMPELKIPMLILTWLGAPMFLWGWLGNLDDLKSWMSFIGGGVMLTIRFVFMCEKWFHGYWMRRRERRKLIEKDKREALELRKLEADIIAQERGLGLAP